MTFYIINEIITPLGIRRYIKVIITVGISCFDPIYSKHSIIKRLVDENKINGSKIIIHPKLTSPL